MDASTLNVKRISACQINLLDESDPIAPRTAEGLYKLYNHSQSHTADEEAEELI